MPKKTQVGQCPVTGQPFIHTFCLNAKLLIFHFHTYIVPTAPYSHRIPWNLFKFSFYSLF